MTRTDADTIRELVQNPTVSGSSDATIHELISASLFSLGIDHDPEVLGNSDRVRSDAIQALYLAVIAETTTPAEERTFVRREARGLLGTDEETTDEYADLLPAFEQ